jgi:predicted nucleotidyltransferase
MNSSPKSLPIDAIVKALEKDERVLLAYIYGSGLEGKAKDIDIAVYAHEPVNDHELSADLKIVLHKLSGLPPDVFDIRVLNAVIEHGDIFGLLYLKNVFTTSRILVDKDPDARADLLERYGSRFRECEGLMQELLA